MNVQINCKIDVDHHGNVRLRHKVEDEGDEVYAFPNPAKLSDHDRKELCGMLAGWVIARFKKEAEAAVELVRAGLNKGDNP